MDKLSNAGEKLSLIKDELSLVSEKASLVGEKASLVGEKASLISEKASLVGEKASLVGEKTSFVGEKRFFDRQKALCAVKIAVNPQWRSNMAKVNVKKIKAKALQIQNAWNEGAAGVAEFRNTKKADSDARIAAAQVVDDEVADLRTQLSMKLDEQADIYSLIDDDNVDIGKGVVGHKDYGDDSELYGAMGFKRRSERKSGLTRKKKNGGSEDK